MPNKLRDVAEVERLLYYLDVLLLQPTPPFVPQAMIDVVYFARDVVWWILQDPRGAKFNEIYQVFIEAEARVEARFKHERN